MAKKRIGENPLDSLIPPAESVSGEGEGGGGAVKTPNQQNSTTAKQDAGKTVEPQNSKEASRQGGNLPDQEDTSSSKKVKVTYYFEAGDEALLERAWVELRRLSGRRVSKSEIVAAALRGAVADLDARGSASGIAKALES